MVQSADRVKERWDAIRPRLVGNRLLDIGAYDGSFVKLAKDAGFDARGVDIVAHANYTPDIVRDAIHLGSDNLTSSNTLLLSTFAYIVRDHGKVRAIALLKKILNNCDKLFFETQLYGDGPGPDFLKTDKDVVEMFKKLGGVAEPLITMDIAGRDAKRTVFEV